MGLSVVGRVGVGNHREAGPLIMNIAAPVPVGPHCRRMHGFFARAGAWLLQKLAAAALIVLVALAGYGLWLFLQDERLLEDGRLGKLQQAIADRRAVRLRHYTASRDAESERVVHPYTLAQRLGHWYLWGHDEARGKALPFRLDRIRECALDEKRFEPPSDAELARGRLFSEAQGTPVRLRLGPLAAAWALARPGQWRVVKRDAKGGAVVEVPGVSDEWATRFALSFGRDAEVLAPPSARRHYGDAVRRALARYR
jgi:predicted DNA-binding transcriptional regulator YafY